MCAVSRYTNKPCMEQEEARNSYTTCMPTLASILTSSRLGRDWRQGPSLDPGTGARRCCELGPLTSRQQNNHPQEPAHLHAHVQYGAGTVHGGACTYQRCLVGGVFVCMSQVGSCPSGSPLPTGCRSRNKSNTSCFPVSHSQSLKASHSAAIDGDTDTDVPDSFTARWPKGRRCRRKVPSLCVSSSGSSSTAVSWPSSYPRQCSPCACVWNIRPVLRVYGVYDALCVRYHACAGKVEAQRVSLSLSVSVSVSLSLRVCLLLLVASPWLGLGYRAAWPAPSPGQSSPSRCWRGT
ncbi:hypothetical protein V8C35DRAFT_308669 [Trichoderma chlorosporum]